MALRLILLAVGALGTTAMVAACGTDLPGNGVDNLDSPKVDNLDPPDDAGLPGIETYSVGGTVAGLVNTGLVLQLNGADDLAIAQSGSFAFPKTLTTGATYAVTVKAQPSGTPAQICSVAGGSGTLGAADISTVTVNCVTNTYTIGGTASGLLGTAVLQNNAEDDLSVSANGTFTFATPIVSGGTYSVTLKEPPGTPSQTCTLGNGSGSVGTTSVTDITLNCVTNSFKVKATVTGLSGAGLVLKNNAGDDLSVSADGTFEFATTVASGLPYAVTVQTQPTTPSQTCTVAGGTGTVAAADVTATINCVVNSFTVGGTLLGFGGSSYVWLQNQAGDYFGMPSEGKFTFPRLVPSGASYAVTVASSPVGFECSVTNGTGTMGNATVTNVSVSCRGGRCLNNPKWRRVTCTLPDGNRWLWSSARGVATDVLTANNLGLLYGGCSHSGLPDDCTLDGKGWVSTQTFTMNYCDQAWYFLGGSYSGDCNGHDGDTVRRMAIEDNDCPDY